MSTKKHDVPEVSLMQSDECVLQPDCRAKYAAASLGCRAPRCSVVTLTAHTGSYWTENRQLLTVYKNPGHFTDAVQRR